MTDPAVIEAAIGDFAETVAEFRRLYREAQDE